MGRSVHGGGVEFYSADAPTLDAGSVYASFPYDKIIVHAERTVPGTVYYRK
jgi:hypothetical protein